MDLAFDETQLAVQHACTRLFEREAGPERARTLRRENGTDYAIMEKLDTGGFLDLFHVDDSGPLTAALVTEWASQAAVLAPVGNRMLVLPAASDTASGRIIAVSDVANLHAVRFAAEADALILIDPARDEVRLVTREHYKAEPIRSKFGYPFAAVSEERGQRLDGVSAARVRAWWQIAIAAEIGGAARAAVDLTISHLRERVQFGRPIASFQAVQHRLADLHVSIDSVQWTVREAAWHGAQPGLAASAATTACDTAGRVFSETHQLTGAMGFTIEYDLHLWTMRLQALRNEAGGVAAHAHDLVRACWLEK